MLNWSKNGDLALKFNSLAPQAFVLNLVDFKKGLTTKLPFLTLPNKCAFNKNKIYCAIPSETSPDFQDDYLKRKFYSADKFISLQLEPIKVEILFDEAEPIIDAIDLIVIENGLYFKNRYDDKVYKTRLK